jgi:hypothetical protein
MSLLESRQLRGKGRIRLKESAIILLSIVIYIKWIMIKFS